MQAQAIPNLLAYCEIYEKEFESARKASLWISALVIGCSVAECLLLMRAITSIDTIRKSAKYQKITVEELCSNRWSLDKLIKLSQDLGWLKASFVNEAIVNEFAKIVRSGFPNARSEDINRSVGSILLFLVKQQRNNIHPGKAALAASLPKQTSFAEQAEGYCELLSILLRCLRDTQNDSALKGSPS